MAMTEAGLEGSRGEIVSGSAMPARSANRTLDWRRKMSDSVAYALLAYTTLQIFVTINTLRGNSASLLPYMALIILIAAIVPACRRFERRWNRLSDAAAGDPRFAPAYRRDMIALWLLAIGLPFALAGLFELLGYLIRH